MFWIIAIVQLYRSTCIGNVRLCIDSINDDLRKIDNWANANGLCINPTILLVYIPAKII